MDYGTKEVCKSGGLNLKYFRNEFIYLRNQVDSIRDSKGLLPSDLLGLDTRISHTVIAVERVDLSENVVGVLFVDPMDENQEELIEYVGIEEFQDNIEWL